MTPAHQRMLFAGFGALFVCGAVNMLLLQPTPSNTRATADPAAARAEAERRQRLALDKVPPQQMAAVIEPEAKPAKPASAPPRATANEPVQRFARAMKPNAAVSDTETDVLPSAPDAEGDPDTIKAVQRELTARGYGPLIIDGAPGPVTRAAIMAFEFDNQHALTGEATETQLTRLLLGAKGGASDPAAGRVRSAHAETIMRTVQQSLAALGYIVGRIDGRTGEDTERAIRSFERDEGIDPKGRVSAEVLSRLGRAVAVAKPQPAR